MDWQKEMDELRRREAFAEELGGPARVKRQHDGGRLTIRERVARLSDPGSFHEMGKIAGRATYNAQNDLESFTPSNFIFGRAKIDGRLVVIGGSYLDAPFDVVDSRVIDDPSSPDDVTSFRCVTTAN